ncbi:FG-GAP-like repeat-containing protein [Stieleria varia]|nr:FG-GAP-like repeat-containing protein [Stieleria varia]
MGKVVQAKHAVHQQMILDPNDPDVLELAGDLAVHFGEADEAIEYYRSAVDLSKPASAALMDKYARLLMNTGRVYQAADQLRALVQAYPDNPRARADYAGLIASLGMSLTVSDHLRWLLRRGKGGMEELIMLADLNKPQTDEATCRFAIEKQPEDLRPLYALMIAPAYEGKWQKVAENLAEVTAKHPDFAPAWALYGRALAQQNLNAELLTWRQQAPHDVDAWPNYWMAAGFWAENSDAPEMAASAFWKVVQIDDSHGEALSHLAANLGQIGRAEEAKLVAQRAADVAAMHLAVEGFLSWRKNSQEDCLRVARAAQQLGRPWEAEAWARASFPMTQKMDPAVKETHRAMRTVLQAETPWQLPEKTLTLRLDLSDLAEFRWDDDRGTPAPTLREPSSDTIANAEYRFADEAQQRGLDHVCRTSLTKESSFAIYQSNAGGAAVTDFDLDGWPDIYLTIVDGKPMQQDSGANQLYRNLDGNFENVTPFTSLDDRGFTQGLTVGDFNSDGFPDLLSGNIGQNRLYRNNGDGTFTDVTAESGIAGERWTSSLAIADLNGDGHGDLVEINYCGGDEVYSQDCMSDQVGEPRGCSPLVFPAEADHLYQGVGDGTFVDVSDTWLVNQSPGHGLGLVIGEIDETPGLDLYVANDESSNQFWSSQHGDDGFSFSEQATVRGIAVDARSRAQASMGIALGDADADGDLDLYVTHFTADYNTLYQQIRPGTWFDKTSSVGLLKPTLPMLAFGTEWLDADNDGNQELLVANGNVDDFSHNGHPLRMSAQFFARDQYGQWSEPDHSALGEYFSKQVVGRALVTTDIDGDGRQDAVVTHLFDPVAALVNRTPTDHTSVRLFLKGRSVHRDAIGTTITATVGNQRRIAQLTAGDGYQCANERVISIGLGGHPSAADVTVQWPGAAPISIGEMRGGFDYLLVEGETLPSVLRQHGSTH